MVGKEYAKNFKVGDKVRVKKSIQTTSRGVTVNGDMCKLAGEEFTIQSIKIDEYYGSQYLAEENKWKWQDYMLEPEFKITPKQRQKARSLIIKEIKGNKDFKKQIEGDVKEYVNSLTDTQLNNWDKS